MMNIYTEFRIILHKFIEIYNHYMYTHKNVKIWKKVYGFSGHDSEMQLNLSSN